MDKVLRGGWAKVMPADRSMQIEIVVNLRTARELGARSPPGVLARSDRTVD